MHVQFPYTVECPLKFIEECKAPFAEQFLS